MASASTTSFSPLASAPTDSVVISNSVVAVVGSSLLLSAVVGSAGAARLGVVSADVALTSSVGSGVEDVAVDSASSAAAAEEEEEEEEAVGVVVVLV